MTTFISKQYGLIDTATASSELLSELGKRKGIRRLEPVGYFIPRRKMKATKRLHIDIETYSPVDLPKAGLYAYAEQVELLLFAYAWDDEPVQLVDVAMGEAIPADVVEHIMSGGECWAHNAQFERVCLSTHFMFDGFLPPDNWHCTAVMASTAGIPANLDGAAKALGLAHQKDKNGKALIRYFCLPCKPTKTNGERTRNLPGHDPAKWTLFGSYCIQDVEVEREIHKTLEREFDAIPDERRAYVLDQAINDRGIPVNMRLVNRAIEIDDTYRSELEEEATRITGLNNPNSIADLKRWLETESEEEIDGVTKAIVAEMLPRAEGDLKRVLEIRQGLGKSSTAKYHAIARSVCRDDRVRGTLKFYGASRTGRWSGQLLQVQNLPSNKLREGDLNIARQLVMDGDRELLEALFGNVSGVLSEVIRTAIEAPTGKTLTVVDFSAIEARMLAWMAGEDWRIEVFKTHGKIYEASASEMFDIPLDEIDKPTRQKGKVAELALGYGGGKNALITMGALKMGLIEDDLKPLVDAWRKANPNIKKLWYATEDAVKNAITYPGEVFKAGPCSYVRNGDWMYANLPSGRRLAYYKPELVDGKFDKKAIKYQGVDPVTKAFGDVYTHGGKLIENVTQAACRDLLRDSLFAMEKFNVVMHVHDEIVIEGEPCLDEAERLMGQACPWADGLPLRGDGYVTHFYRKDN